MRLETLYKQKNANAGVVYNPYLQAVLNQAAVDGVTVPNGAILTKINTVLNTITVTELDKLTQLFIMKYDGFDVFKRYNLVNPLNKFIPSVGVNFTASGANGGGSGYIDTSMPFNTMVGVGVNNHCIGYMLVDTVTTGDYREFGVYRSSAPTVAAGIHPYSAALTTNFLPLQSATGAFHTFNRTALGGNKVYHICLNGTGANNYTVYENGTLRLTITLSAILASMPGLSMYLLAQNSNGTANKFSVNTGGAYYFGSALLNQSLVNTALQTL